MTRKRKVSGDTIARIRADMAPCPCCGRYPLFKILAEKYGLSVGTINRIVNYSHKYENR